VRACQGRLPHELPPAAMVRENHKAARFVFVAVCKVSRLCKSEGALVAEEIALRIFCSLSLSLSVPSVPGAWKNLWSTLTVLRVYWSFDLVLGPKSKLPPFLGIRAPGSYRGRSQACWSFLKLLCTRLEGGEEWLRKISLGKSRRVRESGVMVAQHLYTNCIQYSLCLFCGAYPLPRYKVTQTHR
jgi:hypothetical protein